MIRGVCKDLRIGKEAETWPNVFVAVPRVGDWVRARSGRTARVLSVVHYVSSGVDDVPAPYIELEIQ